MLDTAESDPSISGVPAHLAADITLLQAVQEHSTIDFMSSSSRICSGDFNNVQRST
jgi:hypothetical protein